MTTRRFVGQWRALVLLAAFLVLAGPAVVADSHVPVGLDISVEGDAVPLATVWATVNISINDGSTLESIAWMQTGGVAVRSMTGADTETVAVRLAPKWQFRLALIDFLSEPPIGPDQLPPNVPYPEEHFAAGLQDRFEVLGINPFALEEAGLVVLEVVVTTTSGTYHAEVEIHTHMPWSPQAGIPTVPIGMEVLFQGKEQASYDWTLSTPSGSSASLSGAGTRYPWFAPDVTGKYEASVTDLATMTTMTLDIFGGEFVGVITGIDDDGRPVGDPACTGCHSGNIAPDAFTPWAQTGHAEIFTDQINFGGHYSTNCFACHTVGYNPDADNGGIDEAADFQDFLDADYFHISSGDNWTTILAEHPETARKANIQCENCHGPQDSNSHTLGGGARVDLSSDVCATCHGEPLRHARFQQWQLSGHANYELAIDEGESGSCSRCHTANGFLAWLPVLLGEEPGDIDDSVDVTWEPDEVHPQTCAACHDPHAIGTTSGSDPNATVRISGDTPELIAGYSVTAAGKAAICMTCHNSRRGLRNDDTFTGLSDPERAPHGSAQTDVLMGENAFGVNVGVRGGHAFIEDSCVTCHMEATPPPADLSYNQGGTNHTFYASPDICVECHGLAVSAEVVQGVVGAVLADVNQMMLDGHMDLIEEITDAGKSIDFNGDFTIANPDVIDSLFFGESRGRQALGLVIGGVSYGPYRMGDIDVIGMGGTTSYVDEAPDGLLKAGWNWNLINNDGSMGVHNPTFALTVLDAARDMTAGGGVGGPRSTSLLTFP